MPVPTRQASRPSTSAATARRAIVDAERAAHQLIMIPWARSLLSGEFQAEGSRRGSLSDCVAIESRSVEGSPRRAGLPSRRGGAST